MAGSEKDIFWSPDYCQFRLCYVYEPLDADVVEFDINPDGNNDQWYGVQASLDHNPLKGTVNAVAIGNYSILKKIDTNGGGVIMFDEFCKYAIEKQLDLEDDDDFDDVELGKMK